MSQRNSKVISAGRLGTLRSCQWRSSDISLLKDHYMEVAE